MKTIKTIIVLLSISLLILLTKVAIAEPLDINLNPNIKVYAFEQILVTWDSSQWDAFDKVVNKESGWTVTGPHYPTGYTKGGVKSSASGLCGFLDGTFKAYGEKTEDPYKQIDYCIKYISDRYKTPKKALDYHLKNGHY